MAIPTLPDVNLSVDLSGASCCSNNKKVIHNPTTGSFVVKERSCFSRLFCLGGPEKDENRRALQAFKRAVEDHCNMPFEDVAYDAAGIDSTKMIKDGENLKPQHFDKIASHARQNRRKTR